MCFIIFAWILNLVYLNFLSFISILFKKHIRKVYVTYFVVEVDSLNSEYINFWIVLIIFKLKYA